MPGPGFPICISGFANTNEGTIQVCEFPSLEYSAYIEMYEDEDVYMDLTWEIIDDEGNCYYLVDLAKEDSDEE